MSATPFRVAPPCSDAVLQAQNGCDNRSGQRCAVPGGGHRDRPVGLPIDIVGGAIDGVDHPEDVRAVGQTAGLCRGALLAEETIGGTGDEQCLTNGVLGCAIGAGDQVGVARLCEARRGVGPHFGLRGRRHLSPDPGHGQGNLGQVDCCWGVCGLRGFGAGRTHEPPTHSRATRRVMTATTATPTAPTTVPASIVVPMTPSQAPVQATAPKRPPTSAPPRPPTMMATKATTRIHTGARAVRGSALDGSVGGPWGAGIAAHGTRSRPVGS